MAQPRYLEGLQQAMEVVCQQGSSITTDTFTVLCDHILASFDHLGTFMYFAKMEMTSKNDSLKRVIGQLHTLKDVVDEDKKAGRVMAKNSCARNLHRLLLVISFVRQMLDLLMSNPSMPLKDAFYKAYLGSLATIHTYVLQTAVWAALGLLPTKATFLKSIGETDESAKVAAVDVIQRATAIVAELEKLYADVGSMPVSDVSYIPMAATSK